MSFKNVLFLGMVLWVYEGNAQKGTAHPVFPKSGREIQSLIPKGWQILSQAAGDLNEDGYEDIAFVVQNPVKKIIEYNNGIERDTLQTNPRVLGIYFGKRRGKFKKVLQSDMFIINRSTPTMDEPFKGLEILSNGDLQIDFYIWPCRECTSWSAHEYRFRYQNKAFELIGYKESVSQRVSGDDIDYVVDFQKGTLKIITTTLSEYDDREYGEESKKFELQQLQTLQSLGKPFEWEFQQLRI